MKMGFGINIGLVILVVAGSILPGEAESCGSRWTRVFANDANGATTFGDKTDLLQAVSRGADVRLVSEHNYATSLQNLSPVKGELCGQALFHISKNGYNKFTDNAYWWFVMACTNGYWYMARYNVGEHTSRGDNEIRQSMEWFVREKCDTEASLSIYQDGTVIAGSVANVVQAVQNGWDVRISSNTNGYSFPVDNLQYNSDESIVGAQSIWHVSQTLATSGDHDIFQSNAYWWFSIWSTDGQRSMSRWSVGKDESRGATTDTDATDWYADPCWTLAYKHDAAGNHLSGSLTDFVAAVEKGHRVKVLYSNYSIEPTQINIHDGHVNAMLIDSVSKSSISDFQTKVYWYWQIASTRAKVTTIRYIVGKHTPVTGETSSMHEISWFVDKRPWKRALSVDSSGHVTAGSKAVLAHAVRNGAEVRYRLKFGSYGPSDSLLLGADNLAITDSGDVGATHVRSVSVSLNGDGEIRFQNNPYWWFTITSTTGSVDMSRWTVGEHRSRGHSSQQAGVEWFISE